MLGVGLPIQGVVLTGERAERRLAAVLAADVMGYSLQQQSTVCGTVELWRSGLVAGDWNEKNSSCVGAVHLTSVCTNSESCRCTFSEQCSESSGVSADRQNFKGGLGVRNGLPR